MLQVQTGTGLHIQKQLLEGEKNVCLCFRVFSDRLVDHSDMETFVGLLSEKLASHFDVPYHTICPNKQPPLFGTRTHIHTLLILVLLV